jgi:dephospho-CoA kinase
MITIGLTGGIASGKSEVGRMLAAKGAHVVDADRVAHSVYAPGAPGYALVIAAFGPEVVAEDGTIDRRKLGSIVFGQPERLKQLTDIVWPLTGQALANLIASEREAGRDVLIIEAALLPEAGWKRLMDAVWLVRTPIERARERVMQRDGLTEEATEARLRSRQPIDPAIAELIIDNDGPLEDLQRAVDAAWLTLSRAAR